MSVLVARYCSLCLPHGYLCPCPMLLRSLSTAHISLSLSNASALLFYHVYIYIYLYIYIYICPCRMLVRSLSNGARQGKQQCATRTIFDLLKKKFNFLHTRFSRTKHTWKESGEPNYKGEYKKVRKLFFLIMFFS